MTFIIIAPGLRDVVASPELFRGRPVEETQGTARTRRTPGMETEHPPTEQQMLSQGQQAQQRYEQTAGLPHERAPALVAEQIMSTPALTLEPDTRLDAAWAFFREHRFRHVPIVGADRRMLGVIAERDLLLDAAGMGVASGTAHTTIRPLMVTRVLSATASTAIREIAQVLFAQHIGAMPIVNEADYPIGIISRGDILHALVREAPLELWV